MDLTWLEDATPAELEQLDLALKSPKTFAETFLINPETEEPFKLKYVQEQLLSSDKQITFVCVSGNTRIINPNNLRPTPINQGREFKKTYCFDLELHKTRSANCKWFFNSKKPCIRLTFATGVYLELTTDHEVFDSKRGLIPAELLRPGDKLLAPGSIDIFGNVNVTDDHLVNVLDYIEKFSYFPDEVFNYNKLSLKKLLDKCWMRFGRVHPKTESLYIMTNDNEFALDFRHLLLRFGVESRITDSCVFIDDIIDKSMFLNLVGIPSPILEVRSPRRWEIILDVKKVGIQDVYDLSVDHPDHNFLANDIVVHNCCHRRAGKTYSITTIPLWAATTHKNKMIVVFAPASPQIQEFFRLMDKWIEANPWIQAEIVGKRDSPLPVRKFRNGCEIHGHITGKTKGPEGNRRGLTPDFVVVDEAQDLKEKDWRVVLAMVTGDPSRRGKVKTFYSGTIIEPGEYFYKMIYETTEEDWPANASKIFIPVTEDPDYTEEAIEEIRRATPPDIWQTEWLLRIGGIQETVFPVSKVEIAKSIGDWDYDAKGGLINWSPFRQTRIPMVRFLGVDWDKAKGGSNIIILQYDPIIKHVYVLYHHEVPKGDFTLSKAVEDVLDLYTIFRPAYVGSDNGLGGKQWEDLYLESEKRGYDLHTKLKRFAFNGKEEMYDLEKGGIIKKQNNQLMVGYLRKKLDEHQIYFPESHKMLEQQLLTFKVVGKTNEGPKYNCPNDNKHILDATLIALYGVWSLYENPMLFVEHKNEEFHQIGAEILSFNDVVKEKENQWAGLFGKREVSGNVTGFYRSPLFDGGKSDWERHQEF